MVINLYASNYQENFFKELQQELLNNEYPEYCLMGKYNAVFDREQERKSVKGTKKFGMILPKSFLQLAKELNLVDMWRTRNLITRNYTFSQRHKSWSRIDMRCMSATLMKETGKVDILARTFEDHNPIFLKIQRTKRFRWRLNLLHLKIRTLLQTQRKK